MDLVISQFSHTPTFSHYQHSKEPEAHMSGTLAPQAATKNSNFLGGADLVNILSLKLCAQRRPGCVGR